MAKGAWTDFVPPGAPAPECTALVGIPPWDVAKFEDGSLCARIHPRGFKHDSTCVCGVCGECGTMLNRQAERHFIAVGTMIRDGWKDTAEPTKHEPDPSLKGGVGD